MIQILLFMALIIAAPAYAQERPGLSINMPPAFQMQEITQLVSPAQRTRFAQIAKPNQMLGAYLSPKAIASLGSTANNLPEELVIVAVPKNNPVITFQQFPMLKQELAQQMQKVGAVVFANHPYWMGTTKQTRMGNTTYLFSTAAISIKNYVLMVQVLQSVASPQDVAIHHQRIATIADHLIAINTTNMPLQMRSAAPEPVSTPSAQVTPSPSKSKLYVARP